MTAYYNEIDPYAAQWLRNLIDAGHIAPGDVDERSIADVRADDVRGYAQCHFFAGIGGWSISLRLAEWPDDRPVWTGSCPCQPFSAAGAGQAADDSRHLWPAWFPLIAECRPAVVFGEQVEAAIGWGWLDAVFADLEQEGYACGAAVLPACSVGAPHIRQRLWFVAESLRQSGERRAGSLSGAQAPLSGARIVNGHQPDGLGDGGEARLVADADRSGLPGSQIHLSERGPQQAVPDAAGASGVGGMENANGGRRRQAGRDASSDNAAHRGWAANRNSGSSPNDFWSSCDWLPCTDGKARPVEPGSFPLAHGVQRRASKLRAYGNAIVPQTAAQFILAVSSRSPSQSHVTAATQLRGGNPAAFPSSEVRP